VKKCRCKYAEVQQWVADAELVLSGCGCRGGVEMKVQRWCRGGAEVVQR